MNWKLKPKNILRLSTVAVFVGTLPFFLACSFCHAALSQSQAQGWGGDPFLLLFLLSAAYLFVVATNAPALIAIAGLLRRGEIDFTLKVFGIFVFSMTTLLAPIFYVNFGLPGK